MLKSKTPQVAAAPQAVPVVPNQPQEPPAAPVPKPQEVAPQVVQKKLQGTPIEVQNFATLHSEFQNNPIQADQKFVGKRVKIRWMWEHGGDGKLVKQGENYVWIGAIGIGSRSGNIEVDQYDVYGVGVPDSTLKGTPVE